MFRRIPIRDWFLLFVCGWIIAHAIGPRGAAVRTVTYRRDDGSDRRCVIDADDPSISIIQDRIRRWDDQPEPTSLAVARWRRELADLYCQPEYSRGTESTSTVSQASYEPNSTVRFDTQYWSIVRDKADAFIRASESAMETRDADRGSAPVHIGAIRQRNVSFMSLAVSSLIAMMLATGMCLWSLVSPPIGLNRDERHVRKSRRQRSAEDSEDLIEIEIPEKWIRIHQPIGVKLRRLAFGMIVFLAVAIQLHGIVWL